MVAVRIYLDGDRAGPLFRRAWENQAKSIKDAVRGAARDAADEIVRKGRADIEGAGRFSKWAQGLNATVTEGGGNIRVSVSIDKKQAPWFWVFQNGMVIHGKPLLWIPLSFAQDAQGVMARDFGGGLFRVDRKSGGAPLLLSIKDKQPKYFGKEYVTEPKKFHVVEIARDAARRLRDFYAARRAAR